MSLACIHTHHMNVMLGVVVHCMERCICCLLQLHCLNYWGESQHFVQESHRFHDCLGGSWQLVRWCCSKVLSLSCSCRYHPEGLITRLCVFPLQPEHEHWCTHGRMQSGSDGANAGGCQELCAVVWPQAEACCPCTVTDQDKCTVFKG